MFLCADKSKGREAQTEQAEQAAKELVGVEFAFHTQRIARGCDLLAVAVDVLGDEAVLAGVDVEFEIIRAVGKDATRGLLILVVVGIAGLGLLHFLAEGKVGAVVLLDNIHGDVDGRLRRRLFGRDGEPHRDIEETFAVNGEAPNQTDVFLRRFTEIIVIGRERHGEEGKTEQNRSHAEVEKNVPACFLQAFFALFDGDVFHQLVLVLVNGQCACCIKFLFGHKSPISAEHFKTATEESAHNGTRRNQKRRHEAFGYGASLGGFESGAKAVQHPSYR